MYMKTAPVCFCMTAGLSAGFLAACATKKPDQIVVDHVFSGDLGTARVKLADVVERKYPVVSAATIKKDGSRDFILDYMRLGVVTLSDGYAPQSGSAWDTIYAAMRQQALNKDNAVPAFLLTEEAATIWKGEPFEQALAYHYTAIHYAMQGSWDNARSAAIGSQFQLKGLSADASESTEQVIYTEAKQLPEPVAVETDFALGYLLQGISCHALARNGDKNRVPEAVESFDKALSLNLGLAELVSMLKRDAYNTVFVVDYGRGPEKFGTGQYKSVPAWRVMLDSDSAALQIVSGSESLTVPQACDVNVMASKHVWNDLQDMTKAKAAVGSVMIGVGGALAASRDLPFIGLAVGMAGVVVGGSSAADVRHCEATPQRIYVAPVAITTPDTLVSLSIPGQPEGSMCFRLDPPEGSAIRLCYVRLTSDNGTFIELDQAPEWATSGLTLYSNDRDPDAGSRKFPFILGGDCVRSPSEASLAAYKQAGFLTDMTLGELEELYRAEGITWESSDYGSVEGMHVLEGGSTLATPHVGTAGWARLFGQAHPPYAAKSQLVKSAIAKYRLDAEPAGTTDASEQVQSTR
jgi:hypothetical protein